MFKKLCEVIGNQLIKFEWFQREVEAYKIRQEKQATIERLQRNKDDWKSLMKSGGSLRSEEKEDGGMKAVVVDYIGWGMKGQEPFNPVFSKADSLAWGIERSKRHDRI